MAWEDWLQSYAELEGIADVLRRMAHRARRPNPLAAGKLNFSPPPPVLPRISAPGWLMPGFRCLGRWAGGSRLEAGDQPAGPGSLTQRQSGWPDSGICARKA